MTHSASAVSGFPVDFVWGAATSAYQIEGGAHADGRGASVWDQFCRQPGVIADGSSGDTACDHHRLWADDLDLMRELGLRAYRFSISWPRVQPQGQGAWNAKGLDFYERLIDGLLARGIAPYLTLHHWDLPQALQEHGGWAERDVARRFADYAQAVAQRFGDRVASIATHNEPWVVATLGHERGLFAPGLKDRRLAFRAAHHLLWSHGLALQAMRAAGVRAPLGIVLNQGPVDCASDAPADRQQARLEDGLLIRWYMDPLLLGRYPDDVLAHLGADAPPVQAGDLETIRMPLDFLGLNYYTRQLVGAAVASEAELTDMGWEVHPQGLTDLLLRLRRDYPLPPVYITENGAAYADTVEPGGRVHDAARIAYLRRHIDALRPALQAGVPLRGYFAWSLLDNFEWAFGYTKRFGLVHVDYGTQQRRPKDSAYWYRDFIALQRGAVPAAA
jgi:beta-glucosidase